MVIILAHHVTGFSSLHPLRFLGSHLDRIALVHIYHTPRASIMAHVDRDPSVRNGRTSRASSARSRGLAKPVSSTDDMFAAAGPGVMSMLKTSTDSGDIGDLSFNTSRLPSMPRAAHRRRTNVARLSASSHHSNHSNPISHVPKRATNTQAWDAVSAISHGTQGTRGTHGQRDSLTSVQTMQTMPSSVHTSRHPSNNGPGSLSYESRLTAPFSPDGRSYSLTQPQPTFGLKSHRSATSLRSQGSGPYPTQRNPYAYPTRLKRPGHRVPSPALSDMIGPVYRCGYGAGALHGDGSSLEASFDRDNNPYHGPPYQPLRRYHGISSIPLDGTIAPNSYGRGRPPLFTHNRDYALGLPMPQPANSGQVPQPLPTPHMPNFMLEQQHYPYRTGNSRNGLPLPGSSYGGTMQAPPRLYTPQTDSVPSSSEPGSSAPPSSNPPTPRDATTLQVTLDPIFIDPGLSDLPDEKTEPQGFPNYLKYVEKAGVVHELDAAEPAAAELDPDPTPPRLGFVQRIKTLLEDRSIGQSNVKALDPKPVGAARSVASASSLPPPEIDVSIPAPKNATNLDVEEQPFELPAVRFSTSTKPVELEAPARLTLKLIKANTAPSSSAQTTISGEPFFTESDQAMISEQAHADMATTYPADEESEMESVTASSLITPVDRSGDSEDITAAMRLDHDNDDYAVHVDIPCTLRHEATETARLDAVESIIHDAAKTVNAVSPMRTGEEVVRDSLVSPMNTQTMHISAVQEQSKVPGCLLKHGSGPLSSCTGAQSGLLGSETSTRFSLPPDLSLLNDQDAISEVVTDVAIRFSIPRPSDQGKAQLVSVHHTNEPGEKPTDFSFQRSAMSTPLRETFFIEERIAPLQIKKSDVSKPSHLKTDSADLSNFIRRSFPRRQSVWPGERLDSSRFSCDFNDSRFSGTKSPPGNLPRLKEESQEDMSVKEFHSSGPKLRKPSMMTSKVGHDIIHQSDKLSRPSYLPPRAPRMTLSELRNIPSLNFSRMDLIDKLNEALEIRSSTSVEVIKRRDFSGIYCPSPLRPSSTEALRERYTSFFAKPEVFEVPEPANGENSDGDESSSVSSNGDTEVTNGTNKPQLIGERRRIDLTPKDSTSPPAIRTVSPSIRTRSPESRPMSRPMSPEELLHVAQEVNRLSIPSVAVLTERLSEWLPSIKRLNIDCAVANEKAFRDTIQEIHHIGQRPDSEALVRSSTGLRRMAAAADDIVTNGTHDSVAFDGRSLRLTKELPLLPEDTEAFSLSESGLDKNTTLATEALSSVMSDEPERPKPVLLRVRSLNDINDADQMHPGYPAPVTNQTLAQSTHHSRPWNLDEYYPWAGNTVDIDIDFPAPILRRNSSASTVLRRSKVSSDATSEVSDTSENRKTARARSPLADGPTLLLNNETFENSIHRRKTSKRSLMGSLSRRIGLGGHKAKSAIQTSVLPELPGPTKPGDRYPSTALIPLNAFNIDEVRSFFSDSTMEDTERRGSFRKHINTLRSRLPGGPITMSASRLHSIEAERNRPVDQIGRASEAARPTSLFDDRFTEPICPLAYEGMAGMGKVEFRVKRVSERLRHVWLKTGEIIRSLSSRGRPGTRRLRQQRERADWLDDSLYSGT